MTGKELADKFRLAVESVAPGFTTDEISEFLTQGQLALVKSVLTTPLTMPLARLHRLEYYRAEVPGEEFTRVTSNALYGNSWVYKKTISDGVLKLINVGITALLDNSSVYYSTQPIDSSSIHKFLNTATNKPYLEKPVVTVTSMFQETPHEHKDIILIFGDNHNFSDKSTVNIGGVVEYVTYPIKIDAGDEVIPIQFPEFADDIVEKAAMLALRSLYDVQGIAQQAGQSKQEN